MDVDVAELQAFQRRPERIRNFCILAHVDHGKTTLSDHLIASNGLINQRLVGEVRYLDSREDEQARGITMKSSSITLLYVPGAAQAGGLRSTTPEARAQSGYLVNLIDSPGHVDFCSEVSTAARLSDGGLVVVDAVEGVRIQTHAVLRQAFQERVQPCLFVNKIDRLVLELRMTPAEAFERVKRIVSECNHVMSQLQSEKFIREADAFLAHSAAEAEAAERGSAADGAEVAIADDESEELVFRPEVGNVAFGSAVDGWAFTAGQFAEIYAKKLGASPDVLKKALWGDFCYHAKEKKVVGRKKGAALGLKPMFVQFALEPIWKAYEAADMSSEHQALLAKIVSALNLNVDAQQLRHPNGRQALRAVMRAWLPLSEAVLSMAAVHMPSPLDAAHDRVCKLIPGWGRHEHGAALRVAEAGASDLPSEATPAEAEAVQAPAVADVERALSGADASSSAPLVLFVSKMVAVPAAALPRLPGEPAPEHPLEERFVGFGRVFAGTARDGDHVHVLSPKYDPAEPNSKERQEAKIRGLYLMMGRSFERVTAVPAGSIVAVGGLERVVLKSATLCSSPYCNPFAPMVFQSSAIVRVSVEPRNPAHMPALEAGLRLIERADPFVEVHVLDTGELVLGAAGEVHLETCVKDLTERFARVELVVSPPLVGFRESILHRGEAEQTQQDIVTPLRAHEDRVVVATTSDGRVTLRVRARPLPAQICGVLEGLRTDLQAATGDMKRSVGGAGWAGGSGGTEDGHSGEDAATSGPKTSEGAHASGDAAGARMEAAGALAGDRIRQACAGDEQGAGEALDVLRRAWLLGPRLVGPNVLVAGADLTQLVRSGTLVRVAARSRGAGVADDGEDSSPVGEDVQQGTRVALGAPDMAVRLGLTERETGPTHEDSGADLRPTIESGVVTGFQVAASSGPLCGEPMWGVAFEVDALVHPVDAREEHYGPLSGQIIAAAVDAFRTAVAESDPRLVEAMYLSEVTTSTEGLAGAYAALNRRRARILSEEAREGTDLFVIRAYLPVQASFGFAGELRMRSSGAATAQLMMSHWERLQVDPFFVPRTQEEREEFGEAGQGQGGTNLAADLIRQVRKRKGLPVEEKVVESATKQRTLAKKK